MVPVVCFTGQIKIPASLLCMIVSVSVVTAGQSCGKYIHCMSLSLMSLLRLGQIPNIPIQYTFDSYPTRFDSIPNFGTDFINF